MFNTCNVCGRNYVFYAEGHTPNSRPCLLNQLSDLKEKNERLTAENAELKAGVSFHRSWEDQIVARMQQAVNLIANSIEERIAARNAERNKGQ